MKFSKKRLSDAYSGLRNSRKVRNLLTFLVFVLLAGVFWLVMALNDSVQENVAVKLKITNAPDSVTFITLPPEEVHVSVNDKGTSLLRSGVLHHPTVNLNFTDFARDGVFRVSRGDFLAAIKSAFSTGASITSVSIDSLNLIYTSNRGKRVPVVVSGKVSAKNGLTIPSKPGSNPSSVLVYSNRNVLDTITRVFTESFVRKGLTQPTVMEVRIRHIPGVRVIPDRVDVSIPVEALVKKQVAVEIKVNNVPDECELLLFPQKARVVCYVPMSRFGSDSPAVTVTADYNAITPDGNGRIPLEIERVGRGVSNAELLDSSVEYTIVKKH